METAGYVVFLIVFFLLLVDAIPNDGQIFTRQHRTTLVYALLSLTGLLLMGAGQ